MRREGVEDPSRRLRFYMVLDLNNTPSSQVILSKYGYGEEIFPSDQFFLFKTLEIVGQIIYSTNSFLQFECKQTIFVIKYQNIYIKLFML